MKSGTFEVFRPYRKIVNCKASQKNNKHLVFSELEKKRGEVYENNTLEFEFTSEKTFLGSKF